MLSSFREPGLLNGLHLDLLGGEKKGQKRVLALKALAQKWQVAFMILFPWPKRGTEAYQAPRGESPKSVLTRAKGTW